MSLPWAIHATSWQSFQSVNPIQRNKQNQKIYSLIENLHRILES